MLGMCAGWRDHPELPEDLREPLATAKPLETLTWRPGVERAAARGAGQVPGPDRKSVV